MTDNEKDELYDPELQVFPKIESSLKDKKPLYFDREDATVLRNLFQKEGYNLDLNKKELASIIYGTQLRTRVVLDENDNAIGVEVYKRSNKEGERWVSFDESAGIAESDMDDYFWDGESGRYDRSLGLLRILGPEKFAKLARDCYTEAKSKGYKGVIGKEKATKGRGLLQMAANTLLLGITDPHEEEIADHVVSIVNNRINGTLLKSFIGVSIEPEKMDKALLVNFENAGVLKTPEELKKTAGIDPDSYIELIRYLSGKPNTFGAIR